MKSRAALFVLLAANAFGSDFEVAKGSKVSFAAKITAASFTAISERLVGEAKYDEKTGILESAEFSVPAESLDTGLSLRNRHMREKYLATDKFKDIRFRVGSDPITLAPGKECPIEGFFTIKGVEKPIKLNVKLVSNAQPDLPKATARFPLNILDFGIPQPSMAVVTMDPVVDVTVELVLKKK